MRSHRSTPGRSLAAALAILAVAAPSALAQPADMHAGPAQPATPAQDLRSPDTRDAATRPANASQQDLRHLRAGAATTTRAPLPGPPSWPAHPQPISPPSTAAQQPDDGIDTATIALGIAASLLTVGTLAGIASRTRRPQRRRVTA